MSLWFKGLGNYLKNVLEYILTEIFWHLSQIDHGAKGVTGIVL